MNTVNLPRKPAMKAVQLENFRGVDFSSELGAVAMTRSPDCVNMISDQNGRPVKRFGYEKLLTMEGRINGIFRLVRQGTETKIIHCGTKIYRWNSDNTTTLLYSAMADTRSSAYQMNSKLWILDGKALLRYDGTNVVTAQSVAYTPTTTINGKPTGGGKSYDPVNLLSAKRKNMFIADDTSKIFQLDTMNLDAGSGVTCKKLKADGTWETVAAASVDYAAGKVTFASVIGATPVNGDDNLSIEFKKTRAGNADKINKCTTGILWGLGGFNRLFVTGNPAQINADYASEMSVVADETTDKQTSDPRDAPTYFPDTGYALVGQDNTRITGYLRSGENLAILKEDNDQDATVFLRSATMNAEGNDMQVLFPIKTGIAGVGAISPHCMKDLRDDHMFLSRQGVFSITTNAVTSERYAQPRSELINKKLCAEQDLAQAVAVECDGKLYLAINGHVYVADASQRSTNGKSSEQYQYEWFFWDNVPARCWYKDGDDLLFGTQDGKVMRFYKEKHSLSYSDDGQAIHAYWTTPEIALDTYSKYKTIRRIYTKLNPYARSGVKIYMKQNGAFLLVDQHNADVFQWDDIDFNRFTFNLDTDVSVVCTRVKAKKVITTQIRFENSEKNEPFGLYGATVYYDLKNRVK